MGVMLWHKVCHPRVQTLHRPPMVKNMSEEKKDMRNFQLADKLLDLFEECRRLSVEPTLYPTNIEFYKNTLTFLITLTDDRTIEHYLMGTIFSGMMKINEELKDRGYSIKCKVIHGEATQYEVTIIGESNEQSKGKPMESK